MIELFQLYQHRAQVQNTPDKLFERRPLLRFKSDQEICPLDGKRLQVLKTETRTIKAIGIGTFQAHHTILHCKKHPKFGVWRSQILDELAAANSNVAYTVIVEIGKLRFLEKRQIKDIRWILLEKHSIDLSTSEVELLVDKFVFYIAVVHQESAGLIREQITYQGGYILHLDATCEADSPKLISSLDSVSGFVLYSAKINSENKAEIGTFLQKVKENFGTPHAVVSDLSQGIAAAVKDVFGDVRHFICQFHFLRIIGDLLFEQENDILRKTLARVGTSGKLKELRKILNKKINTFSLDKIEMYLEEPQELGRTGEATQLLAYYLILWILDYVCKGHGYGFPFDQRYLNFYDRLKAAQTLIDEVHSYYPALSENDYVLWKIYNLASNIVDDEELQRTVENYRTKLSVFSDLRQALRIAPEHVNNGLTQMSEIASPEELQQVKAAVIKFSSDLELKIKKTKLKKIVRKYLIVKERIEKYWDKLFADPLVVNVDGKEKFVFVHRTNNLVENHFRQLTYGYRRIHGNRSVRRNLENIPEQLPLTENLKNSNYVKLVFEDESKIAKRFAKVEVGEIRKMLAKQHSRKQLLGTRKTKRFIRQPKFKDQLKSAFSAVAS